MTREDSDFDFQQVYVNETVLLQRKSWDLVPKSIMMNSNGNFYNFTTRILAEYDKEQRETTNACLEPKNSTVPFSCVHT